MVEEWNKKASRGDYVKQIELSILTKKNISSYVNWQPTDCESFSCKRRMKERLRSMSMLRLCQEHSVLIDIYQAQQSKSFW
jgi:hypothetical protein